MFESYQPSTARPPPDHIRDTTVYGTSVDVKVFSVDAAGVCCQTRREPPHVLHNVAGGREETRYNPTRTFTETKSGSVQTCELVS